MALISAADRLREHIEERRPPIGDAPPSLPGTEWRPAGDGGWNLWDRLPNDGQAKRWRYFDRLTAAEWEAIKNQHGAEVEGEQTILSILLTSEQTVEQFAGQSMPLTSERTGEQFTGLRPGSSLREHSGLRLIPGGSAGDVGPDLAQTWPVVSNLALVPALTSEQAGRQGPAGAGERKVKWNQPDGLLTSEQLEAAAKWLWSMLPKPSNGWWDVTPNGKGFVIKQRWRVSKKQETQPYPRISREQFLTLRGMSDENAKEAIRDAIAGHLDEVIADPKPDRGKRDKARRAAARLNIAY